MVNVVTSMVMMMASVVVVVGAAAVAVVGRDADEYPSASPIVDVATPSFPKAASDNRPTP